MKRLMIMALWLGLCVLVTSAQTRPMLARLPMLPSAQALPANPEQASVPILGVLWSPDGRTLAVATELALWLYDVQALNLPPRELRFNLSAFDFDSTGAHVVLGTVAGEISVIRLADNATVAQWQVAVPDPNADKRVRALAFAPNNQLVAFASAQNILGLYDLKEGQLEWLVTDGNDANALKFSPDSKTLAIGNARLTIDVRDTLSGKITRDWQIEILSMSTINDVDYSPNGERLLIGGVGQRVLALDMVFGERGYAWDVQNLNLLDVDWSPDGALIAITHNSPLGGSSAHYIQIWRAEQGGESVAQLQGHTGIIRGLAFSPDATQLASISEDGTLRLWNPLSGEEVAQVALSSASASAP